MQPQSPSPDFDFMLKDNSPVKRRLPIPTMPKPAKIALGAAAALVLIIIVYSLLAGRNSGSTQPFIGVLSRAQETLRVTALVQQLKLQDSQTQALAATVNNSLSSDKQQITDYLAKNHVKVSSAQLAANLDKTTDTSMQTASQNNGLDNAYVNYLKNALAKYQNDLQAADKASGPNGKKLLSNTSEGVRTILNSSPVRS